jgi:ubiquinone/menaquinone biosynthesis C-methylase UbiE
MAETDKAFTGAIPVLYDRHLGPLLFEPYAADIAARVARLAPARVLETACGTGIVTRALRAALPSGAAIVATDLNQPMLDHAATRLGGGVTWRQADATALPFGDAAFDAVVCQFGAMFFPDKVAGFREAWRVLRAGGAFLFSVWDRIEANEPAQVVSDAVAALFPGDPPQFLRRTPHGHHDIAALRDRLAEAGFDHVGVETVALRGRAGSSRDAAIGFCQGSPLRAEIEARDPAALGRAVEAAAQALAARYGAGPVDGPLSAHVFTATR